MSGWTDREKRQTEVGTENRQKGCDEQKFEVALYKKANLLD